MPRPNPTMQRISEVALYRSLARLPMDLYVAWTGGSYGNRDSLRFNSLSRTLTEPGVAVPLIEVARRAARLEGEMGYLPGKVAQGVRLHQGSRPAVFLLLRRVAGGRYVAAVDIPHADVFGRGLREGMPVDLGAIARGVGPGGTIGSYSPANRAVDK